MLTKRRYFKTILAAAIAIGSLAACTSADEEYQGEDPTVIGGDSTQTETVTVSLSFDWTDATNADPSGMCVYFYPAGGDGEVRRYDFSSTSGGRIRIASGKYNIICYNNDTEAVRFYGIDDFYSHTACTREGSVMEPIYGSNTTTDDAPTIDNQRVTIEPDMMWGCAVQGVTIGQATTDSISEGVTVAAITKASDDIRLTVKPQQLVNKYDYEIHTADAIGSVAGLSVAISGMAGELTLANSTLNKECVTIPTGATYDGSTIRGSFRSFGIPKVEASSSSTEAGDSTATAIRNYMTIFVVDDEGTTHVYGSGSERIDVTAKVQDSTANDPTATHETIVIDGIGSPRPLDGVSPDVDDWKEKNEEIEI